MLSGYDFPGNIRELESMVYDAVSRHKSGILSMDAFRKAVESSTAAMGGETDTPLRVKGNLPLEQVFGRFPTMKQMEEYLIDESLKRAGGNQGAAAAFLGMTRQALNKRLKRRAQGA